MNRLVNKICTFDEWLVFRCGMTEQEFRKKLEDGREVLRLEHCRYDVPSADNVIAAYRRMHREEMDIIASENIDYSFPDWLQVYEHHTPESFHKMCADTGADAREESMWFKMLMRKWEKRHEQLIAGGVPFENKEE